MPLTQIQEVKAVSEPQKVQVISNCIMYESPKINYSEENEGVVLELFFGDVLYKESDEIEGEDCEFDFYLLSITKNATTYNGYVITKFVMRKENIALGRNLDSNAKTLNIASVYSSDKGDSSMIINGEEVVLERYEDIKIVDGYNRARAYHEIRFEKNGVIYTGYIKTSDLLVEGFNSTTILIVFIFILVGSIAFSIYLNTRKKRKNKLT